MEDSAPVIKERQKPGRKPRLAVSSDIEQIGPWRTEDEMRYLSGIGTWRGAAYRKECRTADRVEMLEKYIAVAATRLEWDAMDPVQVMAHAKRLLYKYQCMALAQSRATRNV